MALFDIYIKDFAPSLYISENVDTRHLFDNSQSRTEHRERKENIMSIPNGTQREKGKHYRVTYKCTVAAVELVLCE
jgi:hypothetical protein